jgi:osmoprotectant transport system ATP-binding protein
MGLGVIEFESVGKTFRDGTVAVVDLNLIVPSHNFTVIVGPSGCGKTTTLRMVNRMLEPTTGRITWDGTPLRSMRKTTLRRQMGYVIQNGGLLPHRTVLENIGTVPALLHWPKKKIAKRSLELLDSVGLERKLARRYPAQLSGGQQQRVGVARALAADPLVLLMDEPFSAVDPVVRNELQEFFLGLQRELGKTVIFITHDIDEAIKLGDQVAIMRVGGHLVQVGTPQQLLNEPVDAFVEGFVGRDRGFRSLSFQPASVLNLERVKVVRDVEAANGSAPVLVIDGDARPVGWADPERPGRVFPLGSTFSPETDSLRAALDSALTSPHGLAVAVTADTGRYAGVVSAETILAKIKDVRVSIAESISVREPEATLVDETLDGPEPGYQPLGEPAHEPQDEGAEAEESQDQLAEGDEPADKPAEVYEASEEAPPAEGRAVGYAPADVRAEAHPPADEPAALLLADEPAGAYQAPEEPVPAAEPLAEQARPDNAKTNDSEAESPHNGAHPIEGHRTTAGHKGDRESNGEALYRRVSNILQ